MPPLRKKSHYTRTTPPSFFFTSYQPQNKLHADHAQDHAPAVSVEGLAQHLVLGPVPSHAPAVAVEEPVLSHARAVVVEEPVPSHARAVVVEGPVPSPVEGEEVLDPLVNFLLNTGKHCHPVPVADDHPECHLLLPMKGLSKV